MAEEYYSIPANPEYSINDIRKIQDSDPVRASTIVNPVIIRILTNIAAVKAETDTIEEALSNIGSAVIEAITLPTTGWAAWEADEQSDEYGMYVDVECESATAEMFPSVALDRSSLEIASRAGLCPTIQTLNGFVRFWAKEVPDSNITGIVALLSPSGVGGGGASYVLPIATASILGGVKIPSGSGLTIDDNGYLRIDAATEQETEEAYDRENQGS